MPAGLTWMEDPKSVRLQRPLCRDLSWEVSWSESVMSVHPKQTGIKKKEKTYLVEEFWVGVAKGRPW